jgi:hypothetical protein
MKRGTVYSQTQTYDDLVAGLCSRAIVPDVSLLIDMGDAVTITCFG